MRADDTLVVPKLDRLTSSVPDACDIGDTLAARSVRLSLGETIYSVGDLEAPLGLEEAGVLRRRIGA